MSLFLQRGICWRQETAVLNAHKGQKDYKESIGWTAATLPELELKSPLSQVIPVTFLQVNSLSSKLLSGVEVTNLEESQVDRWQTTGANFHIQRCHDHEHVQWNH